MGTGHDSAAHGGSSVAQRTWTAVDSYFEKMLLGTDEALRDALAASGRAGLPAISVSPMQGRMLTLLARACGARRILEIGTLGGYSTICLARGLQRAGRLVSLEIEPECARVAEENIRRAGLGEVVEVRLGRALESLHTLRRERARFDFVFIDADKESYPQYLEHSIGLASPGAMIVADNVVRDGKVITGAGRDARVHAVREMVRRAAGDERLSGTAIQTVGAKGYDGFAMWIVNPRRSGSRRASSGPRRPAGRPRPRR